MLQAGYNIGAELGLLASVSQRSLCIFWLTDLTSPLIVFKNCSYAVSYTIGGGGFASS